MHNHNQHSHIHFYIHALTALYHFNHASPSEAGITRTTRANTTISTAFRKDLSHHSNPPIHQPPHRNQISTFIYHSQIGRARGTLYRYLRKNHMARTHSDWTPYHPRKGIVYIHVTYILYACAGEMNRTSSLQHNGAKKRLFIPVSPDERFIRFAVTIIIL